MPVVIIITELLTSMTSRRCLTSSMSWVYFDDSDWISLLNSCFGCNSRIAHSNRRYSRTSWI